MEKKSTKKTVRAVISFIIALSMIIQGIVLPQQIYAADDVQIEINGFQISTRLEAFRTIYSVADTTNKTEEVGIVYGLTDSVSESDMIVGSKNETVYSYAATPLGETGVKYSSFDNGKSYCRTMEFIKTADFYRRGISVRAYAKLKDGTYIYSDISNTSVYRIANTLYKNNLMSNMSGHEYLYNSILSVVDSSYARVEFRGKDTIVTAEAEENTTKKEEITTPKQVETTPEPTTKKEELTEFKPESANWASADFLAGMTEGQYKVIAASGDVQEIVNIQQPGFATAQGIYITFSNADFGNMTVDGKALSKDVEGAGVLAHLSNFTKMYSTVVVYNGDGSQKAVLYVYNAKGNNGEEQTTKKEEQTTKKEETTTPHPVKNPGVQQEAADSEVAANVSLNKYIAGIDTTFSSTEGKKNSNEGIEKLFDNNINTKFFTDDAPVISIAWRMSRATILKNYTLVTANDAATYSHRNPHKWRLLGSMNGKDWIQLDFVENGGIEHKNLESYTYTTDVQKACQYFMLRIEDSGDDGKLYFGSQLSEIYLNGDVVRISSDIGVDLEEHIKGINTSATTVKGYNDKEGVANLFDGDKATKLFTNTATPCSIAWTMSQDTELYSYTLTTANDNASFKNRTIKSWVLYGSKDGNNWEAIDTVTESGMDDVNYADYTYLVDKVGTYKHFKLTVTKGYGNSFQLSEISLKGSSILLEKEYEAIFMGDWDQVTAPNYKKNLQELFDQVYPRQYTRWGTGSEPKRMFITADKAYDGVAYTLGNTIVISVDWMNAHPVGIGYFSHELTHAAQQYGNVNSSGPAWWVENMANYGGFRYYHWATDDNVQVYQASDTSLQDWKYEAYGNNKWFFAYMDAKYPTTKASNGTVTLGLIDSINNMLKSNKSTKYDDNPYDTTTDWNKLVKQITGYDCIESLRLRFVEELKNGTWAFTGFRDYRDNWITEGLEGVDNPTYPMIGQKMHGNTVATKLSNPITSGTNLCNGAIILHTTGQTNSNEAAEKLIDGNLDTKWCSRSSSESTFNGRMHSVKIDLGSKKTFNTYTLYNTKSKEGFANASEWEVLISEDGKNWTSVDYQVNNDNAISSYDIGSRTARYVQIKIFNPGDSVGTVRLYEFQLYNR